MSDAPSTAVTTTVNDSNSGNSGGNGGNGGNGARAASAGQVDSIIREMTLMISPIADGIKRLEGDQKDTRKDVGEMRSDLGSIKERMTTVETKLSERDKALSLVMTIGGFIIGLLGLIVAFATWVTSTHK
jgi:hypothetical protein